MLTPGALIRRLGACARRPGGPLYLLLATILASWALLACAGAPQPSPTAEIAAPTAAVTPAASPAEVESTPTASPEAEASTTADALPTEPPATPTSTAPTISGNLTVFAAASLTGVFTQIGKSIEQANPGSKVTFNFAGSSTLRTQLSQGARADLYASADQANMDGAQTDGSISGDPSLFAQNKLVIITPAQSSAVATPQDIAKPGIKLVIGTKDLPAGNYARQILTKMSQDAAFGSDFSNKALANVVSEETNVKQVVAKVQLGEADAGIVYSTDVTAAVRSQVKVVAIPDDFNVLASYPIAQVTGAANPDGAEAFEDYLVSPAGQAVLASYGFIPAATKP